MKTFFYGVAGIGFFLLLFYGKYRLAKVVNPSLLAVFALGALFMASSPIQLDATTTENK